MKTIRPASEAEVIAEFLKGEYHQKEYHADRKLNERLVMEPDLSDPNENRLRRVLLYRRHRVTWQELPKDVQWNQVQLQVEDVSRIRIFPRGHWPKMASGGNFSLSDIARNIREQRFDVDVSKDVTAIHAIAYRLREQADTSSVLLIGLDEQTPLTIIEGNHRMLAAALTSFDRLLTFRTYVGVSPAMTDCFWYRTTLNNMLRYAWRRMMLVEPDILGELKQRGAA